LACPREVFRRLRCITAAGGTFTHEKIQALDALGMNAALGMAIYRQVLPELFARVQSR
jgi:hypothetical protein